MTEASSVAEPGTPSAATAVGGRPSGAVTLVVAATPFIALVLLALVPGYLDPMLSNPPGLLGLPLGVVVLFAAVLLAAVGLEIVRRSRSAVTRVLAIATLTVPALVAIMLGSAAMQVLNNQG